MDKRMQKSDFAPYLNDQFVVQTDSFGHVNIELVEISDKKYETHEYLSLIFRGAKDTVFPQKIYRITHHTMGEMDLFLVPIVFEKLDGQYYQVVFNYLIN